MSLCRPRGGRSAPRSGDLRSRAEDQMLDRIGKGCHRKKTSARLTPEMRIGYLRRQLEELENDQESLMRRKSNIAGPLLLVRKQINDLQNEIVAIYQGIAEAQAEESEFRVVGCWSEGA